VADAWAECAAYGSGDEEEMKHTILLTLLLAFTASAFEFTGKVVGVYDGDTITVLRGKERVRVRISAVDCPEVRAYFGKGGQQPYSRQATQFTEKLVDGKRVKVKAVGNSRNRLVGIVMLPDGRRLGYELLAAGYGWLDPQTTKGQGKRKFSKLTFHSLRHSMNSLLANNGVDEATRMTLVGHKSTSINKGYTHLDLPALKSAIAKLPELEIA